MKKFAFNLLAGLVACIASTIASAHAPNFSKKTCLGYQWYDFNGSSYFEQTIPSYYSLDANNFPDCPPNAGNIYCEIYAMPSQTTYGEPDLNTILRYRMRP